jgi:hypothetical protein
MKRLRILVLTVLLAGAIAWQPLRAADAGGEFSTEARTKLIAPHLADIDREFRDYAEKKRLPGAAWGIVLDGALVHSGTLGWADCATRGSSPCTIR